METTENKKLAKAIRENRKNHGSTNIEISGCVVILIIFIICVTLLVIFV